MLWQALIAVKGGPLMASATTLNVTMRGIGGHGSKPEAGKDPIVLAAEFVLVAQTIVSRQVDPQQPAVLTVGTIHGGTKNNIIPDEVTMGLTLRTYSTTVRDKIVDDVRRTAKGLAVAYGIPEDRMPIVTLTEEHSDDLQRPCAGRARACCSSKGARRKSRGRSKVSHGERRRRQRLLSMARFRE